MHRFWASLTEFFTNDLDTYHINAGLLIAVLIVLFAALSICILISRKNHLYIKPDKKVKKLSLNKEKEVA